jgi:hypothetical protein
VSDGFHLVLPFAAGPGAACAEAARQLEAPHLLRLLGRLAPAGADEGSAQSLTMPHERVLARAHGIEAPDGLVPLAAWEAAGSGGDSDGAAWAWITPCHWQVGTDHVRMGDPQALELDVDTSRALLAAMQPYFEGDGIALEYAAPDRWRARGEIFRTLPTASLDRVAGRTLENWMPAGDAARPLRRLQQEMQMLMYTLPLNDARQAGGRLPVNSFWVSGTGALATPPRPAPGLAVDTRLRAPALRGDAAAWATAWREIDATEGARLAAALDAGRAVQLTLCGERHARSWSSEGASLWGRLGRLFAPPTLPVVLESL